MNYRHVYHAGNFADVVKHVCLLMLLERLREKPGGFCYLDTHAGVGRYALDSVEAQKTDEYRDGVLRLFSQVNPPPELTHYLERVLTADPNNTPGELVSYPGSPMLARALLRQQDRAVLVELHPADSQALKAIFRGDGQVHVHHMNGYHALKAFLPPTERRGLVLIDPPFEREDEFEQLIAGLLEAYRRWPTGMYAIWYPVKDRRAVFRFQSELMRTGLRGILRTEFCRYPEDRPDRFNGCGMLLVNPPWKLEERLRPVLAALGQSLAEPGQARVSVQWLVPE